MRVDVKVSGWEDVKKAALTTVHKESIERKDISDVWKIKMLTCRHSPIRELRIEIIYIDIPRWIADQLVRHTVGVNNYMGTMRSDRGNKQRKDQKMTDTTVFRQVYNGESFLNMCETRMCVGCVSKETRRVVEYIVQNLPDPVLKQFCAPPCIHRFGCKEKGFTECNHFTNFRDYLVERGLSSHFDDIDFRLFVYKEFISKEEK